MSEEKPYTKETKLILPEIGETTVGELLEKKKKPKSLREQVIQLFLKEFWARGGRGTTKDLVALSKDVATRLKTRFSFYSLLGKGYLYHIKETGTKPFYVISIDGVKHAGIEMKGAVPSKEEVSEEISEALEVLKEAAEEK